MHRASTETNVDIDERKEVENEPRQVRYLLFRTLYGAHLSSPTVNAQIRLTHWSTSSHGQKQGSEAAHAIDILMEDALAATNCPDEQSACALLELAANAGALSLLVCANQYRQGREQLKSMLYAYPLINTYELLESIPVCACLDFTRSHTYTHNTHPMKTGTPGPRAGQARRD